MQVETVPLATLVPDPENARLHPEQNLESIKASLQSFGQVEPLVVRTGTRVVVGGNGRLQAMQELGWKEASVFFVELTDGQARALSLMLNRTAETAEWDHHRLRDTLLELQQSDFDIYAMGWQPHELDVYLSQWATPDNGDLEGFEEPEAKEKEGAPIRLSKEQRTAFDHACKLIRAEAGDVTDGECVKMMAEMVLNLA